MEDRDSLYKLAGIVEVDESYFGGPCEGGKRGRGTDKTPVLVAVSLDKRGRPLYAKREIMKNVKSETLMEFARHNIEEGSTINSDAYGAYKKAFADSKFPHKAMKFEPKENPDLWIGCTEQLATRRRPYWEHITDLARNICRHA
jgi:transposase-like protein